MVGSVGESHPSRRSHRDRAAEQKLQLFRMAEGAPVPLPVDDIECTDRAMQRRHVRLTLVITVLLMLVIGAVLWSAGFWPIATAVQPDGSALPPEAVRGLQFALYGLPLCVGLFGYLVLRFCFGRRGHHDRRGQPPMHPLRFVVTQEGLTILDAAGGRLSGPWSAWSTGQVGSFGSEAMYRPAGVMLRLGAEERYLDLVRLPRRTQVLRAILQQLVLHGQHQP